MSNIILTNIFRFIFLIFLQVVIFKQIVIGDGYWLSFHFYVYPLFLLLLPLNTPRSLVVLLGFLTGLTVDFFYDTLGVHTAAATFTGFVRPTVINWLSPKGGYNINFSPTRARMGFPWFTRYMSILLFLHLFFYFSVEFFTFAYLGEIMKNSISSFIASGMVILIHQIIFGKLE